MTCRTSSDADWVCFNKRHQSPIGYRDITLPKIIQHGLRQVGKTLFILKYRDDHEFRQTIGKQLNKGVGANKFCKAISFGHSHEFIQSEKEDQEIAEGCQRLIKNAIVCWNFLYLSRQLAAEENEERRAELIEAIRNGSAAIWKHFNLHGEFDFSDERLIDSIGLALPKKSTFETGLKTFQ